MEILDRRGFCAFYLDPIYLDPLFFQGLDFLLSGKELKQWQGGVLVSALMVTLRLCDGANGARLTADI